MCRSRRRRDTLSSRIFRQLSFQAIHLWFCTPTLFTVVVFLFLFYSFTELIQIYNQQFHRRTVSMVGEAYEIFATFQFSCCFRCFVSDTLNQRTKLSAPKVIANQKVDSTLKNLRVEHQKTISNVQPALHGSSKLVNVNEGGGGFILTKAAFSIDLGINAKPKFDSKRTFPASCVAYIQDSCTKKMRVNS